METTVSRETVHAPVGFGKAFVEQFRLLWMSRRPLLMLAALLAALALAGEPWNDNPLARLFTVWPVWLILAGPFWGFAVWYNEGPGNRLYFWSHPVSRTGHSMARVGAGAAWLLVVYAAMIVAAMLFAAFDGDLAQFGAVAFISWLSFFTGALIGYLAISALTVWSEYPIRWSLGLLFGFPITVTLLDEWLELEDLVRWLTRPLTDQSWGLGVAMVAPFAVAMDRLRTVIGGSTGGGGSAPETIDLGTWWLAVSLWVLFWAALVFLLARRHPDTFPRWRGAA
ncbi:MAG TPA: hypothetical protein VMM12_14000 [Longimicrobiales bacterium]|nr:hypothetical protein [Longimicrobiales bacterium]